MYNGEDISVNQRNMHEAFEHFLMHPDDTRHRALLVAIEEFRQEYEALCAVLEAANEGRGETP